MMNSANEFHFIGCDLFHQTDLVVVGKTNLISI
jgi:hypothetical protein